MEPLSSVVVMVAGVGAGRSAIEPRIRIRGFCFAPVPKPETGSALSWLSLLPLVPVGSSSSCTTAGARARPAALVRFAASEVDVARCWPAASIRCFQVL